MDTNDIADELERTFATHREKFALKRKMDRQKKQALAQYGPDGPGKGPPDPEPPTGQRMRLKDIVDPYEAIAKEMNE